MAPLLPTEGSALDVGSQLGWFTFNLAERGLVTLGVERDERNVRTAEWLALYNRTRRAAFVQFDLSADNVHELPTVDVALCLSVFHHLVRHHGVDDAHNVMRRLAERTRRCLVFETGQYDERPDEWSYLSFMGADSSGWVESFVRDLGFPHVQRVGAFPGYRSEVPRLLVVAHREAPALSDSR